MTRKKLIGSIAVVMGLSTSLVTTLVVKTNYFLSNDSITKLNRTLNSNEEEVAALQPFEQINHYPILTQKTGPIVSWKNTIKSLDWFGAVRWEIDLSKQDKAYLYPGGKMNNLVMYSKRAFLAWDLDIKRNLLWLLINPSIETASTRGNGKQEQARDILGSNVIKIDSLTGEIKDVFEWKDETGKEFRFGNIYQLYYQISALTDGNVLIHGKQPSDKRSSVVLDTTKRTFKLNEVADSDIKNKILTTADERKRGTRYNFLIPIANDINILVASDFNRVSSTKNPTGDVWMVLVKDDLSLIQNTDKNWTNFYRLKNVFPFHLRNPRVADNYINHTIYRTFKEKIYFTIYNKFFVVDTKLNNQNGLDFAEYNLANSGSANTNDEVQIPSTYNKKINAISSYTVDANENVYYKLVNDSTIYNLKISANETDVKRTTFASETYYDLAKHPEADVKNNANSLVLFNVEGSTGSILAINAKQTTSRSDALPTEEETKRNKYGLAVAIVGNKNNNQGDTLGLLNTEKRFIKSADFDIDSSTLKQKLPSEITRNDLVLKNNGFFTSNTDLDENKNLKYLPFEIKDIDDEKGTFTVIAHLDQIPWFSNTLPVGFVPRKVEHKFTGALKIEEKVNWTIQANLNYDFLNTLPSKVTNEDLAIFDLFQANFASQTIIGSNNEIAYPKKTYSVKEKEDATGKIVVEVNYEYVPLGVSYQNKKDVKTYKSQYEYKIFDSNQTPKLVFAGQANNTNDPINIKNTPVLKSFLQSSILPSSIANLIASKQIKYTDFLNLIESKGYPTNKMKFSLEANDQTGILVFNASLEDNYYDASKNVTTSFKQIFNGFNKSSEYSFSFKNMLDDISINNFSANKYLPSSITASNILSYFIKTKGFDPKDFNIVLNPNDIEGNLTIKVKLDRSYATSIGNNSELGFSNYEVQKTYTGFLKQQEFNDQFNVSFIDNQNENLAKLKEKTLLEINQALVKSNTNTNPIGIEINGIKYINLNDLFFNLLIRQKGIQIPSENWTNNEDIITSMTYDNNAGTAAFFLTIKANSNIPTNLNFVVTYSDFARGNKTATNDNLSFISNAAFNNIKLNDEKLSLNNIYTYLSNLENIKSLFSSVTGEYQTLINQNKFLIKVETSKLFNTARIEIVFENLTNPLSLKTYSNTFVFNK